MPSRYREQAAGPSLLLQSDQAVPFSRLCSPRALYRSYSLRDTTEGSWFPSVSEIETRDSRPALMDNNQAPEKTMNTVTEDANMDTAFHLGEFQTETWWPSIQSGSALETSLLCTDILKQGGNDHRPSTAAFAEELRKDLQHDYDLPSWCQDNNLAVASDSGVPKVVTNALRPSIAALTLAPMSHEESDTTRGDSDRYKGLLNWRAPKEKSLGVQKKKCNGKRPVSQRESHIWSERQRRKGMNHLFSTLRSLLPHPTSKTDKSTVVLEIIKYIQSLQQKLELLTKKHQQMMAGRRTVLPFHTLDAIPKAFPSNGLTLVDHTSDSSAMTAVTTLPPPGSESCLQSYLGTNVGLHVCGLNVFITISSPRGRRGLFQQILVTVHTHQLDVINANISTSSASIFHCLHCQATQGAEFLKNDLHTSLQSVISNFEYFS